MPVGDKEVLIPIVIVINKGGCPTEIWVGNLRCFCSGSCVCEETVCIVTIEGICLVSIIGDSEIKPSIVILVAKCSPHTVFRRAILTEGNTHHKTDFLKSAITVIAVEKVLCRIIRDVYIKGAVVIIVAPDNA